MSSDRDHDRDEDAGRGLGQEPGRRDEAPIERDDAERPRTGLDLARELRLRPDRSPVTRLSRRVLAALGGVSAVAIAAALMFALWPHRNTTRQELLSTDSHSRPDGLNGLPQDYSGFPHTVPQLGPPLPGDLGRSMLAAGATAPGMPQPTQPQTPPDPEAQRRVQERQRLAQEREAARTSRLFASEGRAAAQTASTGGAPATAALDQSAGGSGATSASTLSEGDRKLAFVNGPIDRRTTSLDRLQSPVSRNVVQAGAVIPAALITGLRSDIPGQITAQVTEAVYDSPTGRVLLILQGARLIGQYDSQVAFGQARALLVWIRIIMPNGHSIVLERQPGADLQGNAGLEDQVDNHWGALFKAALLSTILSVGSEVGTSDNENSLVQAIRQGASDSISQTVAKSLGARSTSSRRLPFGRGSQSA